MDIRVSGNFATIAAPFQNLSERLMRVATEGLQAGGDKTRTLVKKALRIQTNVLLARSINERVSSYCPGGSETYIIRATGKPIRIPDEIRTTGRAGGAWMRYSWREHWRLQPRKGKGQWGPLPQDFAPEVTSYPWGPAHTFQRSFWDPKRGPRAALPDNRHIRTLYGPNLAKEIGKGQSLEAFHLGVQTEVVPAIQRKLARAFNL
ncbi:hypothetical protein PQJ75_00820 [Rhodoplanes sp. TEM]|uniref:HK97 gp10 family phage protein n=1 Tax=Rhodoplanes tepidamans TaxID=200616 RepID=A0ABT5J594_RHOTP|nr:MULTISPECIES: hypothetical protein [Rhodoplanes]MDC7784795.1 hypothetical protein [Rhodoplanes tepidamans]MDC7982262.1 hypothetical protein [Rhodoplanes sp. TEM]MDQ0356269.1 hypothetical protein [Rhodoplanes tepidamans]